MIEMDAAFDLRLNDIPIYGVVKIRTRREKCRYFGSVGAGDGGCLLLHAHCILKSGIWVHENYPFTIFVRGTIGRERYRLLAREGPKRGRYRARQIRSDPTGVQRSGPGPPEQ